MHIHEYQAKELFARHGIPVLAAHLVRQGDDVKAVCGSMQKRTWIAKAQVHAGGRGKAGGIVPIDNPDALEATITEMLGKKLVTKQTGEAGLPIHAVLLEKATEIDREFYLALLVDRSSEQIAVIASSRGGVDIEQVARQAPQEIITHFIHPVVGLQPHQVRDIGYSLGLVKGQVTQLHEILSNLYHLFVSSDCSLVEINPLIVDGDGRLVALDAKINFDDNALYRRSDVRELRDISQEDPLEACARELGLSYIRLGGNIGCIVNGAGLAMATMDVIKHHGGHPANFLDVGGGATQEKVAEAFRIVLSDTGVTSVFVNIFGGIVHCDVIARGILEVLEARALQLPVTVLLQGTNATEAKKLLENQSANVVAVDTMTQGARQAIKLAG